MVAARKKARHLGARSSLLLHRRGVGLLLVLLVVLIMLTELSWWPVYPTSFFRPTNEGSSLKAVSAIEKNASATPDGVVGGNNCLADALTQLGDIYSVNIRPALFFMKASSFQAIFFSVPGDEADWNRKNKNYAWQGTMATLIFIGDLFRRASERGFSAGEVALIDVGANMGQEVVLAGMYGFRATTFEILPHSVQAVQFNLKANCVQDDLVTVVNAGASEKTGSVQIKLSGFSASKKTVEVAKDSNSHNATVWSMDDYFLGKGPGTLTSRPLLFKIDCEGCEPGALAGSFGVLERYPPHFILVELVYSKALLIDLFKTLKERFHYSRSFILDCDDQWVDASQTTQEEKILSVKERAWNPGMKVGNCDILFVHDDAINVGLFD